MRFAVKFGLHSVWRNAMKRFNVWIRPLVDACGVRVESLETARWLLERLSQSFVFKNSEPMNETDFFPGCSFRVAYGSQMCQPAFQKLLAAMPEVVLLAEPVKE
jgi:hypothetical protein